MRQINKRTYCFNPLELKTAFFDYLKKIDKPIPEKADELDIVDIKEGYITFTEELKFKE